MDTSIINENKEFDTIDVTFFRYNINRTTKEYIRNFVAKQWEVNPAQIIFKDGYIMLKDKLNNTFSYIAQYKEN